MDIGSAAWMRNIDCITENMGKRLSLEGTVLAQRANELQTEALKVHPKNLGDVVDLLLYL